MANAYGAAERTVSGLLVSHDLNEPPHVHVDRDDQSAKFWLAPVALARNLGFGPVELRRVQDLVAEHERSCWRHGMSTSDAKPGNGSRTSVHVTTSSSSIFSTAAHLRAARMCIRVCFRDSRAARNWRVAVEGFGIHWPDVDEDLSTEGLLRGAPRAGLCSARADTHLTPTLPRVVIRPHQGRYPRANPRRRRHRCELILSRVQTSTRSSSSIATTTSVQKFGRPPVRRDPGGGSSTAATPTALSSTARGFWRRRRAR